MCWWVFCLHVYHAKLDLGGITAQHILYEHQFLPWSHGVKRSKCYFLLCFFSFSVEINSYGHSLSIAVPLEDSACYTVTSWPICVPQSTVVIVRRFPHVSWQRQRQPPSVSHVRATKALVLGVWLVFLWDSSLVWFYTSSLGFHPCEKKKLNPFLLQAHNVCGRQRHP